VEPLLAAFDAADGKQGAGQGTGSAPRLEVRMHLVKTLLPLHPELNELCDALEEGAPQVIVMEREQWAAMVKDWAGSENVESVHATETSSSSSLSSSPSLS
jgi:hypothetical protein